MKRIYALVLYVLAVSLVACSEKEKSEDEVRWFEQPTVEVDGTNAEVSCRSLVGDNVLTAGRCGVVCTPVSDKTGAVTVEVDDPRIEQGVLYARVARLTPHTRYMAYAFLELSDRRMIGLPALFETGEASPEPENPDPDNPDPDNPDPENPDPENPDPDVPTPPRPGAYPGWPELPKMEERPGDYYYATHMCPAFTTASGVFENNLRSYTVCYSHEMMSGMWSAYPIHASYKGSSGRNDSFAYDPKIAQNLQPVIIQSAGSYKPQPGYSRGHLLASNDRTGSVGMNEQTFYVTNMAPQWQNNFNSGIWSTLEDKTWNNVCADTLFVVSGVYYADTNKTVTDNAKPTANTVYVPTHFYKVMIRSKAGNTGKPLYELKADEMQCIAFWFENRAYSGSTLSSVMTSVADVEQKTGLTFFVNVPEAPKQSYSSGDWKF